MAETHPAAAPAPPAAPLTTWPKPLILTESQAGLIVLLIQSMWSSGMVRNPESAIDVMELQKKIDALKG